MNNIEHGEDIAVYDFIADDYAFSKALPFRDVVESYTLFQILQVVKNKRIIDLACGEGFYTRRLKLKGASSVLGVDISSAMIQKARDQEKSNPIGCQYKQSDVSLLHVTDKYDVVTAMYLLNYAKTRQELLQFCKVAYQSLVDAGVFVGMNDNIFINANSSPSLSTYGFTKECKEVLEEGDPIKYIFGQGVGAFSFDNYFLSPLSYKNAFFIAGFREFEWISPTCDPSRSDLPYWQPFLDEPPIIAFRAIK